MNRCPRCALPDVFAGYEMTASGVCNYCVYHDLFMDRLAEDAPADPGGHA